MSNTATYTGRGNILSAVDAVSDHNPYFSIWRGRDIITQNSVNDWDAAYVKLDDLLQALEQSGNRDLITIKFHPKPDKDGYITNKTPIISTMVVRVNPLDSMGGIGNQSQPGELNNAAWYMLKDIKSGIDNTNLIQEQLIARLEALNNQPALPPVVDEVEDFEPDTIDRIGAILEKPGVMDLVKQFAPVITGVLAKYMNVPNMAINGTNDAPNIAEKSDNGSENKIINTMADSAEKSDTEAFIPLTDTECDQLDVIVNKLRKHTDTPILDLGLLATWADANPAMFKSLLSSLKQ